jgi:hypothetical protein
MEDGTVRQVRGYLLADIRAAVDAASDHDGAVLDAEVIDDDL